MNYKDYSSLKGKHALFSPSQPAFFNFTEDEFRERLITKCKSGLGTELHAWAFLKIKRRHKVNGVREIAKDIDEFIFDKYYLTECDRLSKEGVRLLRALSYVPAEVFETLKAYVNDAVSFHMEPEVVLAYSERFFGTSDAVIFSNGMLRIHDLKTGITPAKMEQLLGYDALFCLQNEIDPNSIEHELRIYQNNDILVTNPIGNDIVPFMKTIVAFDDIQREFEEG